MSTALLRQGGQSLQNINQGVLLRNSTIGLRYASLNSAIGRGLRKSQGVGFRGKERSQDLGPWGSKGSSGDNNNHVVRRSADAPPHARSETPITRDAIRNALENGQRNVFGTGKDATTRLRRGKVDVKDTERPVKRSRAARFHDPDSSFGKKSAVQQEKLGKRGSFGNNSSRRAAASDWKERQVNPDRAKMSPSRLAYLEKSQNAYEDSPKTSFRNSRNDGFQEHQEPFESSANSNFKAQDRGFDRNSRYSRDEPQDKFKTEWSSQSRDFERKPRSPRDEPRDKFKTEWPESRDSDRNSRSSRPEPRKRFDDSTKPKSRDFNREARFARDAPRGQNYSHPERESGEQEFKVSKTFDKRVPISIPYTTPASEFLYGTSVVQAALNSRRTPRRQLYKLYIYTGENRDNAESDKQMMHLARRNNVPVERVGLDSLRLLDKMSAGRPHNGYILEASPLPKLPVARLGALETRDYEPGFTVELDYQSREEAAVNGTDTFIPVPVDRSGRKPFIILLDSILDPGNLGGMIRTASFLGVTAIAISTRNSAPFSPVVLKASAGASENITLFSVKAPAGFIADSKAAGWKIYAAVAPPASGKAHQAPKLVMTDDMGDPLGGDPCIMMLGNEGEGLRWNLRSHADVELAIEGSGTRGGVDSLNVSVAMGILCNAFLRTNRTGGLQGKQQQEEEEEVEVKEEVEVEEEKEVEVEVEGKTLF